MSEVTLFRSSHAPVLPALGSIPAVHYCLAYLKDPGFDPKTKGWSNFACQPIFSPVYLALVYLITQFTLSLSTIPFCTHDLHRSYLLTYLHNRDSPVLKLKHLFFAPLYTKDNNPNQVANLPLEHNWQIQGEKNVSSFEVALELMSIKLTLYNSHKHWIRLTSTYK